LRTSVVNLEIVGPGILLRGALRHRTSWTVASRAAAANKTMGERSSMMKAGAVFSYQFPVNKSITETRGEPWTNP
jgi:hypothetical protein